MSHYHNHNVEDIPTSRLFIIMTLNFVITFAELIAAVFNPSVLIGISFYLFIESYHRFISPDPIEGANFTRPY